jgi:hypothetical protein
MSRDERELLTQRFVDNELTAEERIRLLRMLDYDKALKRHLLDTEELIAEAAQLPRLIPPPGFAAHVGACLKPRTRPLVDVWLALWVGRVFWWNVVGAIILGGLFLAALLSWVGH